MENKHLQFVEKIMSSESKYGVLLPRMPNGYKVVGSLPLRMQRLFIHYLKLSMDIQNMEQSIQSVKNVGGNATELEKCHEKTKEECVICFRVFQTGLFILFGLLTNDFKVGKDFKVGVPESNTLLLSENSTPLENSLEWRTRYSK